ncbi:helix-turn-helix domain-containing protein [Sinorhizobium meliloti]|uniref:helix-turn-helix domain-containing protein n=1 Tax=Rhizobium meliloti TaxID=382 RepID=UPI000FD7BF31|nr:helix-turn-helix domain-containing protein [Sinorhizobium meliloti]RVE90101.1 winged helix family transcriptional regulator [Sinorhizobium meliloti]RVH30508.1 winged helix family transcriptional regulator [Sinorhizobium meliloti]
MDRIVLDLQREITILRERVRQLEELLAPTTVPVPIEFGLTGSEARVFAHLATRDMATKQSVMLALYSDRADVEPETKIVDVFVCKMRKKLARFGVTIETVWGQGYRLLNRHEFCAGKAA